MSVYLNNAATTWPKPECVPRAVYDFMTRGGANLARGSASERDIRSLDTVYMCRAAIAEMFGGYERRNAKYVTFTANVTESINTVLKGTLKPGMRVVTSSMEHNAVMRPLRSLEADGVSVEVIRCSIKGKLDPLMLGRALETPADMVIINHASNVCGTLQDIEAIAGVCAARSVPLVLDCAQTAGIVPVDVEKLGLAALCFTGHKGLYAPQGIGGIVWSPSLAERCAPYKEGGTGSFSHEETQPSRLPDKFEAGTPNLPAIAGLYAALEWIKKTGAGRIREKEAALGRLLYEGMRRIDGVRVLGPDGGAGLPVYAITARGKDNGVMAGELSDRYGIETRPGLHCSPLAHKTLGTFPAGALRLSVGYFNTKGEIEETLEALGEVAAVRG